MSKPASRAMSVDEFFAWQERQDERYELVGGQPLRMMVGASNKHDRIVMNISIALGRRLDGDRCLPFSGGSAIETYPGQIRRPDVGVDCGRPDPDGFSASEPRLVVEVLSPSTRDFDSMGKLAEYKSVGTLDYIIYVEPNRPEVRLWSRDESRNWVASVERNLAGCLDLPTIGVELPLAEVYAHVTFSPNLASSAE